MLKDIERHIKLTENSIGWAKTFGKDTFPYDIF